MNALVSFRANAAGHLSPTVAQRQASREQVVSNFAARLAGIERATAKQAGAAAKTDMSAPGAEAPPLDNGMDRDAFLQLLVLELKNQDPTDPMDNRDMVTQLAQFSSLEASTNLNENFQDFADAFTAYAGNVDQLNFINAQSMLGNYVEGFDATGEAVTGTVESVHLSGSIVMLGIDGRQVPMTGVMAVAASRPEGK